MLFSDRLRLSKEFVEWAEKEKIMPLLSKETKEVIEKFAGGDRSLAIRIFPKILSSDPAVRILKAKPGQIIEIRRVIPPFEELAKKYGEHAARKIYRTLKSLIPSGEEIYYRVVVEEQ